MQFSFGGTLLILLLAFGALVAAGVPLLLGLTRSPPPSACSAPSASSPASSAPSPRS